MLFSLLYFLVRRLLGAGSRLRVEKDIELLVLRHQVKVTTDTPHIRRIDVLGGLIHEYERVAA